MTNMHNGHVATCLCCTHLYIADADYGYSEMTPGCDMAIECSKGCFEFDMHFATDMFTKMHDLGPKCKSFEARDYA